MHFVKLVLKGSALLAATFIVRYVVVNDFIIAPAAAFAWIVPAITAVGSIVGGVAGGLINRKTTQEAGDKNAALQREFAKKGIGWKVRDAQRAGIHPLAALGAQTISASPSYVGDTSMGEAVSNMGQDVSRAMAAGLDAPSKASAMAQASKMTNLQIENQSLQNDLLRSQIARINQQGTPSLPSNSEMPLLTGQAQSLGTSGGYVLEKPLEAIHTMPGNPAQEVGKVSDYGFVQTPTGLAIVPSKDVKEKIEDQFIPEAMWAFRNQLLPNFGAGPKAPDPKYYPLPKGADFWKWHHLSQEFRPARKYNKHGDYVFLK